jgi:putative nucleotidyltransferase with HDIG domain
MQSVQDRIVHHTDSGSFSLNPAPSMPIIGIKGTLEGVGLTPHTQSKPVLLKRVIATLGELPISQAGVVSTVMRMTADINTEIHKLSHVLSADQALTARVLRMSNSPFYGRMRGVSSLNEAIMILGFYTIRSLVVATSTCAMFKRDSSSGLERDLWHHSLAVALGARIVARHARSPKSEEAFLAGLMHDIAILVMLQRFPDEYRPVLVEAKTSRQRLVDIEREQLGFTHAELGAIILEQWNLPEFLVEVTRSHHSPDDLTPESGTGNGDNSLRMATHIVCFADGLAESLGYGFLASDCEDPAGLTSTGFLDLSPEAIGQIAEELNVRYTEELKLFEE